MIFTFYSYKGGSGRTMALVNIAEVFYQAGLRVLLVDFDLEAPSLETYFADKNDVILESPGILDLLQSYKRSITHPGPIKQTDDAPLPFDGIQTAMVNVRENCNSSSGSMYLMSVGRRVGGRMEEYSSALLGYNWIDFYDNWEGEIYFNWLRNQFYAQADVTLVDCRTGLTDVSAICCGHIADIVILVSSLNSQELSGCKMMTARFFDSKLSEVRESPLKAVVVPSEVTSNELSLQLEYKKRFFDTFAEYVPDGLSMEDLWQAAIPWVPYFSFGNTIAALEDSAPYGLGAAYRRLAHLMACISNEDSVLYAMRDRLDEDCTNE